MPLKPRTMEWSVLECDINNSADLFVPPGERVAGAKDRALSDEPGVIRIPDELELRIGTRPTVVRLLDLYAEAGRKPPIGVKIYREFDIWVVVHAVSAIKRSGPAVLRSLEYVGVFDDARVATEDLFPSQRYRELASVEIGSEVEVGAEGEIELPSTPLDFADWTPWANGGVKAAANVEMKGAVRLRLAVRTSLVEAVGRKSGRCQWVLHPNNGPLWGDHLLVQTVRVPHGAVPIKMIVHVRAELQDWYQIGSWTKAKPFLESMPVELQLAPQ